MTDCVDMKTNTCIFGYGGIDIGIINTTIVFKGITPFRIAGSRIWEYMDLVLTKVGDWEYTGSEIFVSFKTIDEIKALSEELNKIETNRYGCCKFNGITFNFKEYKQESMNVVKSAINHVRLNILLPMAC